MGSGYGAFPKYGSTGGGRYSGGLIIGIPTGIISAKKQYSAVDNVSMVLSLIGVSMPNFWFGLLVVIVFALNLGWLLLRVWERVESSCLRA